MYSNRLVRKSMKGKIRPDRKENRKKKEIES